MRRLYVILLAVSLYPQMTLAQVSFDPGEGCLNVVDFNAGKGLGENGPDVLQRPLLPPGPALLPFREYPGRRVLASVGHNGYLMKAIGPVKNEYRTRMDSILVIST